MGSISANANKQCPPGCRARGWLALGWARGNEAHRKAWMPVVNHPETHLSWPGLHILCAGEHSSHRTFRPVREILMCQAWKTHCSESGTEQLKNAHLVLQAFAFYRVHQNTRGSSLDKGTYFKTVIRTVSSTNDLWLQVSFTEEFLVKMQSQTLHHRDAKLT